MHNDCFLFGYCMHSLSHRYACTDQRHSGPALSSRQPDFPTIMLCAYQRNPSPFEYYPIPLTPHVCLHLRSFRLAILADLLGVPWVVNVPVAVDGPVDGRGAWWSIVSVWSAVVSRSSRVHRFFERPGSSRLGSSSLAFRFRFWLGEAWSGVGRPGWLRWRRRRQPHGCLASKNRWQAGRNCPVLVHPHPHVVVDAACRDLRRPPHRAVAARHCRRCSLAAER